MYFNLKWKRFWLKTTKYFCIHKFSGVYNINNDNNINNSEFIRFLFAILTDTYYNAIRILTFINKTISINQCENCRLNISSVNNYNSYKVQIKRTKILSRCIYIVEIYL